MANYDVEFAHSTTATPDVVDIFVVMHSVLGVPDNLAGEDLRDYIESYLRNEISGIAKIEDLVIHYA
ncbi:MULTISPECIES: hypothetical protein [unclassified Caballeronia]|uniref:hypothetical protein n=1 Tax=unclassified Caballeronia TaxID=2646786 RepID=UPI001F1CFD8D|nr:MULTISPECIES: hypothetical protein [unclassified Caballeronia]MCE4546386.1 hypothetical protein [Caballeronia sp. PC1]MCE4573139.1 hypothetical protein [Caballeronia sp. CLC5]